MSGYQTILRIRRLEAEIDKLGLRMEGSKLGNFRQEYGDVVALMPKEDALPIYSRDAEIFFGSLEEMEIWIQGFQKAREYDRMLMGNGHEKKRERAEQNYRNKQLLDKIAKAGLEGMETK
jgi:hypothetical protein